MKNNFEAWKSLSPEIKLLMRWMKWLDFDSKDANSTETYFEYIVARDWLRSKIWDEYELTENVAPPIRYDNALNFWFEFDSGFDKDSLLEMEPDKKYEIKKRYNGYTMIEIE